MAGRAEDKGTGQGRSSSSCGACDWFWAGVWVFVRAGAEGEGSWVAVMFRGAQSCRCISVISVVLAGCRNMFHLLHCTFPLRGYESMVMARMLTEDPDHAEQILGDWACLLPVQLQRYGETAEALSAAFERIRNAWMTERTESWMQLHQVG